MQVQFRNVYGWDMGKIKNPGKNYRRTAFPFFHPILTHTPIGNLSEVMFFDNNENINILTTTIQI